MSFQSHMLPDSATTLEVRPENVAAWIDFPPEKRPRLIDCREADELAICQIVGSEWYPLGSFPEVRKAIIADVSRGVVVYCHHGMRSQRGALFLRACGVENAFSMSGGIEAWAKTVEPGMRRY